MKAIEQGRIVEPLARGLLPNLDSEIEELGAKLEEKIREGKAAELRKAAMKYVIDAKKSAVVDALAKGLISQEVAMEIMRELDSKTAELVE